MLVCHCWGVSDRDIRDLARGGSSCPDDILRACSAGGDCGGCCPAIEAILAEERKDSRTELRTLVRA